jgi:hypothetical protein
MAGTGGTPGDSPASPDDINGRLAEIAAELSAEATFKEPSAAERAHARAGQPWPPSSGHRAGPLRRLQDKRTAAELRKPVQSGYGPPAAARRRRLSGLRQSGPRLSARRLDAGRLLGRRAARGRPQPVPDRGYAAASGGSAHRSLLILVSTLVVIIAACACVVALTNRP